MLKDPTMYKIEDIADWFLSRQAMSPKKLQKLTYCAQAWSNALLKRPLMDTNFEAWVHGPVSHVLYKKYKDYGWTKIEKLPKKIVFSDAIVEQLLESVWVTYKDQSANELEVLTHREMPWQNARVGIGENEASSKAISDADMQRYYLSIYNGD